MAASSYRRRGSSCSVGSVSPELSVARDGRATIATGELEAYVKRLGALSPQALPRAAVDGFANLSQKAFLQTWGAIVSSWVGQEVVLGQTTKGSASVGAVAGGAAIPLTQSVEARGFIPCTTSEPAPGCVGISVRHETTPGDAKKLMQQVPGTFGGKAFTEDQKQAFQTQGIKTETFVLLDPNRTLPYRLVADRFATLSINGVETATTDHEEWLFHYTFADRQP